MRIFPAAFGLETGPAVTFFLFWLLNMYVVYLGVESIKNYWYSKHSSFPAAFACIVVLDISAGNGLGPILSQPSKFASSGDF